MEGQSLLPLVPPAQAADWIHQVQPDTAALRCGQRQLTEDLFLRVCVCQGSLLWGFRLGGRHRGDNWHQHERRQTGRVLLQSGEYNLVQSEVPLQWWEAATEPHFRSRPFWEHLQFDFFFSFKMSDQIPDDYQDPNAQNAQWSDALMNWWIKEAELHRRQQRRSQKRTKGQTILIKHFNNGTLTPWSEF